MSKFAREVAVITLAPTTDHSSNKGFLVKLSSGAAALNDSTTVPAFGVILDGEKVGGRDSVGVLGGNLGPVKLKASGAIAQGAFVKQTITGEVVTDSAGARVVVGRALEAAANGELFEAVVFAPVSYAA